MNDSDLEATVRGKFGLTTMRLAPPLSELSVARAAGFWRAMTLSVLGLAISVGSMNADVLDVPNGSFELPVTPFADPRIDAWEKSPKPFWFEENETQRWDQLTGVFANTDPGAADHIDNMDGNQAIFLFALPEVALFQDYDSIDWTNSTPTHAFDEIFEVGKSYQLTVGLIGGGGGMLEGVALQAGLYYRENLTNKVIFSSTNVIYSPAVFTNTTHFIDFHVNVPTVQASDAWAGQHIGIQLASMVAPEQVGGYWDVDHVRLTTGAAVSLVNPSRAGSKFTLTLQSAPDLRFDILATENATLPLADWTLLGTVTNLTGTVSFTDTAANADHRYYQARQAD